MSKASSPGAKWRSLKSAGAVIALAAAAAFVATVTPPRLDPRAATITSANAEQIARGKYIAELGDCTACHTAPGGAAMAGGRELETPFGVVFSTNISADQKYGLGHYSFAEFDRAMRKGVNKGGENLYPAMPYPSYARMSGEDMQALYAFLKFGQPEVAEPNKPARMQFPFGMRFGLAFWNAAFLDTEAFVANPDKDAAWNRGAYLVQGLGHCGACHTPRGIGFQEKAMSDAGASGKLFVSGAKVENWNAVNLRDLWTVDETVELLKTGQNSVATASGGMTEVIHHSTQHFTQDDLVAVATYLKSLPTDRPHVAPRGPSGEPQTLFTTRGGLAYAQFCNDCHRLDGAGVADVFPPLAGNPTVAADDPATLVHIMLTGWKTAETQARPRVFVMPGFARLPDQEIAEILTFIRENWGNRTKAVTAEDIAKARAQLDPKVVDQTAFIAPRLADVLSAPNAAQLVRGMRLNLQTRALLPDHVGDSLNCSSCHLNAGTVADGSPYVGVSASFPSYAPRAGKVITLEERINGCFKRSMNGKPLPVESDDMKAMIAFFDWMKGAARPEDKIAGRGVGKIDHSLQPNSENGRKVYDTQCTICHGKNGEGLKSADGTLVYPPLWGDQSFNIGAGMARLYTAGAFVQRNMPIGFRDHFPLGQGGLSDQDAIDVADYFSRMARPDFAEKNKDWPKDPKPKDARY